VSRIRFFADQNSFSPYAHGSLEFKEVNEAIVAVFQSPTLTQAKYEESVRRLTGGRARI
jgi:hypothetical protein